MLIINTHTTKWITHLCVYKYSNKVEFDSDCFLGFIYFQFLMYYDYYKSQYIDFKSSFFSSSKSTTSLILNSSDSQSTDIELCMFLITLLLI